MRRYRWKRRADQPRVLAASTEPPNGGGGALLGRMYCGAKTTRHTLSSVADAASPRRITMHLCGASLLRMRNSCQNAALLLPCVARARRLKVGHDLRELLRAKPLKGGDAEPRD